MRQVIEFNRAICHKRKGKSMDDWILDEDIAPETVEFSEAELETLEMTIEFFLDGYCEE